MTAIHIHFSKLTMYHFQWDYRVTAYTDRFFQERGES